MTDVQTAAAYDARAAEYIALAGELAQMEAADIEVIGRWRDSMTGPLLDAGCGPGHWTAFLHGDGHDAQGIDLSAEFITAARARFSGLAFQVGSLRQLPFPHASFGGILAWYSLIHTPPEDLPAVLGELARVLLPGGSLLIGYFEGTPGEPFAHAVTTAYFWDAESLGILLRDAGFIVTAHERRERVAGEPSTRPHGSVVAVRHGTGEIAQVGAEAAARPMGDSSCAGNGAGLGVTADRPA